MDIEEMQIIFLNIPLYKQRCTDDFCILFMFCGRNPGAVVLLCPLSSYPSAALRAQLMQFKGSDFLIPAENLCHQL